VGMTAEWEPQQAVLLSWPHEGTDWAYMIEAVTNCYVDLACAIAQDDERLIIVANDADVVLAALPTACHERLTIVELPINDTWVRDYGPLAVRDGDGNARLLDFTFNAWGMKFAADCDNMVTRRLAACGLLQMPLANHLDLVLEGGSVECDGHGSVLTTSSCLLQGNRNPAMNKQQIEQALCQRLGCSQVLWLDHGSLAGDDTDGHIDTLARFAPGGVLLYTGCDNVADEHFAELQLMEQELKALTDADGNHYHLVKLPFPEPIYDQISRLPATYANFLVMNHQVLVPSYGQPDSDSAACRLIAEAFPGRDVFTVDCRVLLCQHGSLHCATMQLPAQSLNPKFTQGLQVLKPQILD